MSVMRRELKITGHITIKQPRLHSFLLLSLFLTLYSCSGPSKPSHESHFAPLDYFEMVVINSHHKAIISRDARYASESGIAVDEGIPLKDANSIRLDLAPSGFHIFRRSQIVFRNVNDYTWYGVHDVTERNSAIVVYSDGDYIGNFTIDGHLWQIRPTHSGGHLVRRVVQSAFPSEARPVRVFNDAADYSDTPTFDDVAARDDGSYIDVMVVYSPAADAASPNINGEIQLAIDETNASFDNSDINPRFNLVHTEEVTFNESASASTNLSWLMETEDNIIDNVHTLRDTHGADLVVLLVEDMEDACGIAYLMETVSSSFESLAFSVTRRDCATGYYTFGHECGHNMGAHHDRDVTVNQGAYEYSYGYLNVNDAWRTIMAYNDVCVDANTSCSRIQYWSNPDLDYDGEPLGVPIGQADSADNRATLNNTALTVSNFRNSNEPALVYSLHQLFDANDALNAGDSGVQFVVYLTNVGSVDATGVEGMISSINNIDVTASDYYGYWGTLSAGETDATFDHFGLDVNAICSGSYVTFDLLIWDDQGRNWEFTVEEPIDCSDPSHPYLGYYFHFIDDDHNDVAEDGEEDIEMVVYLHNTGGVTASGIQGEIVDISSPWVTVTDNSGTWSDINAGQSQQNSDWFEFTVDEHCVSETVEFELLVSDDQGNEWIVYVDEPIVCEEDLNPELDYVGHFIEDGNDDAVEGGETDIDLVVYLRNVSADDAMGVSGEITNVNSPYVSVSDSQGYWGTIGAGAMHSSNDYFVFSVDELCDIEAIVFEVHIWDSLGNDWYIQVEEPVDCPDPDEDCGNSIDDDGDGDVDCDDADCDADPQCQFPPEDCSTPGDEDNDGFADCDDPDCVSHPYCMPESDCANTVDDDNDGQVDCCDTDCAADPNCTEVCDDTIDNDCDNDTDCDDSDCSGAPSCSPETDCTNGLDDDGDGNIDCNDSDCSGDPSCQGQSEVCGNGLDDDGDGATDCDDADCASYPDCQGQVEVCDNGLDDDGDGSADCDDPDCTNDPSCQSQPEDCANGLDDDGDGDVDCDDADCAGEPSCQGPAEDCANGLDDDGDGAADCDDPDCSGDPNCQGQPEDCANGADDDLDGLTDCDDTDCQLEPHCNPEGDCTNSVDDDLDGLTDCCDGDCAAEPSCLEVCDDGADNDCDALADCDDSDCAQEVYCNPETECADGIDDDLDGFTDCCDSDCSGAAECAELCDDGADNDCDGSADCDDDDCGAEVYCNPEIDCGNGLDDDLDGTTDCDDPDCFADDLCLDADGDGFTVLAGDCDDFDAEVYPGAAELCDGLDNDCDGQAMADEVDADGDGYWACADCDDLAATVHPGAEEQECDGVDNDCDGEIDEDADCTDDLVDNDGDGYVNEDDCDDSDWSVHPGADEVDCDGIDNDCDGEVDEGSEDCGGEEPEEPEGLAEDNDGDGYCEGEDLDGDGVVECADGSVPGDCNDLDNEVHPGALEVPFDLRDNNCDGNVDEVLPVGCQCEHGSAGSVRISGLILLCLLILAIRRRRLLPFVRSAGTPVLLFLLAFYLLGCTSDWQMLRAPSEPIVELLAPADNQRYVQGDSVEALAYVYDRETDLAGDSLPPLEVGWLWMEAEPDELGAGKETTRDLVPSAPVDFDEVGTLVATELAPDLFFLDQDAEGNGQVGVGWLGVRVLKRLETDTDCRETPDDCIAVDDWAGIAIVPNEAPFVRILSPEAESCWGEGESVLFLAELHDDLYAPHHLRTTWEIDGVGSLEVVPDDRGMAFTIQRSFSSSAVSATVTVDDGSHQASDSVDIAVGTCVGAGT